MIATTVRRLTITLSLAYDLKDVHEMGSSMMRLASIFETVGAVRCKNLAWKAYNESKLLMEQKIDKNALERGTEN